ncbi:MAG: type II toxin-antitoxin system RelB/DinJ family antitoxin [Patescibacteria group bacterium]|jgi:addiction module RelB/DinJ family antitoxin
MKTIINVKADRDTKIKAQRLAKELGLPLSVVINQYLKDFIQQGKITFSQPLMPNTRTRKMLDRVLADIKKGKNVSQSFNNAKDLIADLRKK